MDSYIGTDAHAISCTAVVVGQSGEVRGKWQTFDRRGIEPTLPMSQRFSAKTARSKRFSAIIFANSRTRACDDSHFVARRR